MAIHIYQLIAIILFTICAKPSPSVHASSLYYSDLSIQNGSSCAEKTQFATTNDPFYDWVTRSYLIEGFETDYEITIQEAGSAYKKLSAWRVADSSRSNAKVRMFNAPEPHVIGGFYRPHPHNIIAKMTVDWGLSIRVCLAVGEIFQTEGQNMCRITGQVIALEQQDGNITFNMLLSEINYNDSNMMHLTNWVSNARVPEAVGVNRTVGMKNDSFWYYSNPKLATLCSGMIPVFYRADMAAYSRKPFGVCKCVDNVCAQGSSFSISSGVFYQDAGPCKNASSYWFPLNNGVFLYIYSSKFDYYYALNSTFNSATFPDNITKDTLDEMKNLSSCFQAWLVSQEVQEVDPLPNNSLTLNLRPFCGENSLVGEKNQVFKFSDFIVAFGMRSVTEVVENAVATGDDCQEETQETEVEKVCCSHVIENEKIQEIKNIINTFSQIKEVKDVAQKHWKDMASKRHDAYLDIVTAFLAVFTTTGIVFSNKLVAIERFIVRLLSKCRCGLNFKAFFPKNADKEKFTWVHFVRWLIRVLALGPVIGGFMSSTWETLRNLKSGPSAGWTQTVEYQPNVSVHAFLITTTSIIQVSPVWTMMWVMGFIFIPYFIIVAYLIIGTVKNKHLYPVDTSSPTD